MASRIIHLAITNELIKKYPFKDPARLKLGSVLPDACAPGRTTEASHLKIKLCGATKKTYDLTLYREKFDQKMREDDLYLGYYLHLIQDILFRYFMYEMHHWDSRTPGNVDKLHNDYVLINTYVVRQYQLTDDIVLPEDFEEETIYEIYPFDAGNFVAEMKQDFLSYCQGEPFFFTQELADAFIRMAMDVCARELETFWAGEAGLDEYLWAWKNKPCSLLETTLNTRDLGGYRIQDTAKYTRMYTVLRSDRQEYPSEKDMDFLKGHHITTIIDMRGDKDVSRAPSGFAKVPGFHYCHIPIDEGSGIPESVEAVPYSYMDIALAANTPRVFQAIAAADEGVMINCTAGKDRTGVISAILLMLCNVSDEDIVYDYMLTRECSGERFDQIHRNFPEVDMNIVIPNENNMRKFLEMFRERFSDIYHYFKTIGVTDKECQRLKEKLTLPA
ncbi:MAG: tyrosine-protein phosphatase [Acetatifactor sp.]|nr:tyrosine-protein phosphatase [Acetatifactor sp.]